MSIYLPFNKAREIVRKLANEYKLSGFVEWVRFCKSDLLPLGVPFYPHQQYKKDGWKDYRDWLDVNYLSFEDAKIFVQNNGIKNLKEWKMWKDRPKNIPCSPDREYKNKGWKDWWDWFGKRPIAEGFIPFIEAREIVRKMGLKNCKEWQKYTRSPEFNFVIPKAPDYFYREWTNWYDFLNKSTDARIYKVNDNYFKKWSHNSAYILGLWFADGYMIRTYRGSCIFSIKQHIKDRYIMEDILKEMGSNYPIRDENKSNCCYFEINSKIIYNDIIRLGGKERKSLDVKFPYVPKKYLPDFIRGLWDGDGCISSSTKTKSGKYIGYGASIVGGSKNFINDLGEILKKQINDLKIIISNHKIPKGSLMPEGRVLGKDSVIYTLSLSTNNLRKLRDYMYSTPSTLKLIRKYDKFVDAGEYKPAPGDIKYLDFESAKKLMVTKNFRSMHNYHKWIKSKDCKVILPASPNVVYKQWISWPDFLGHYKVPYNELSNMAIQNNINGRRGYDKWIKNIRGNTRGKYPRHPQLAYKEWQDWDKFLGRNCEKIV